MSERAPQQRGPRGPRGSGEADSGWTVPCWACGEEMEPGLSWHRDHDARSPTERAIHFDLGIDSAARDRQMRAQHTTRTGPAPEGTPAQRCARCGVPLLPNEHTRERGICHSCWSQELAYGAGRAQEPEADHAQEEEEPAPCLLCRRPAVLVPLRVALRHVDLCLCPEHRERLMHDFGSWLADWIGGDSVLLGQMLQGPPPPRHEAPKEAPGGDEADAL